MRFVSKTFAGRSCKSFAVSKMSNRTTVHPITVLHGAQNDTDSLPGSIASKKSKVFHQKEKKRTSYLKKRIYQILSNSMLTGIPQIVNAESIFRKLVKIVVFVFCTTGFFYQLWLYMRIYRGYPTVVDLQLKYPEYVELPSVTICNNNAIQKLKFCRDEPEWCDNSRDLYEVCKRNRRYCLRLGTHGLLPNTSSRFLPKPSAVKREYSLTREELVRYSSPPDEFITKAKNTADILEKKVIVPYNRSDIFTNIVLEDNKGKRKLCFTMYSAVKTGRPLIIDVGSGFNHYYSSIFTLYYAYLAFHTVELFQPDYEATVQVQVHSPYTYVNPYMTGFEFGMTRVAGVVLSVSERNLLPPPYDTGCTDYKELWDERGKKGPLSREMCIEECVLVQTLESCKCVKFSNLFPHSYRICNTEEEIACSKKTSASHCNEQCKPACHSVEYDSVVNQFDMEKGASETHEGLLIPYLGMFSVLSVFIGKPEVMIYTHNAKYETIEAFGYLGGYIGIWLGISFIALLDFAESMILLLKNLVAGLIRYRKRKTRQTRGKKHSL